MRPPSLRVTLTLVTIAFTAVALVTALALVLLTARMRETTMDLTDAVESVRLAREAEVALLLFARAAEPLAQQRLAAELNQYLSRAGQHLSTERERRALADARARVDTLLETARGTPEFGARETRTFAALERLVDGNRERSRMMMRRAGASDRLANMLGFGSGLLLVAMAVAAVWWLRARAFQPVFELAGAMDRFGRGDRGVRARELGPRELRDMIARFNQMARALAAHQGAQAAFLAAVAHDLRTPLSVLVVQLELLRPDKSLPPEPVVRRSLEMVRRQVVRLERMLGDLAAVTAIDAGAFTLDLGEHDLGQLARGIADLFEGSSPVHDIVVDVPAEPLVARCDRLRLEQVVTNLLSNAIKYSPAGGRVTVALRRSAQGHEAVLSVRDTGVGISADEQRRLFEPFRRTSSARGVPGSGLGLYVVRRIVEAHHGRVEVESAPAQGAEFRVYLPLVSWSEAPAPQTARRAAAERR